MKNLYKKRDPEVLHERGLSTFRQALEDLEAAAALFSQRGTEAYAEADRLFRESQENSARAADTLTIAARLRELVTP